MLRLQKTTSTNHLPHPNGLSLPMGPPTISTIPAAGIRTITTNGRRTSTSITTERKCEDLAAKSMQVKQRLGTSAQKPWPWGLQYSMHPRTLPEPGQPSECIESPTVLGHRVPHRPLHNTHLLPDNHASQQAIVKKQLAHSTNKVTKCNGRRTHRELWQGAYIQYL